MMHWDSFTSIKNNRLRGYQTTYAHFFVRNTGLSLCSHVIFQPDVNKWDNNKRHAMTCRACNRTYHKLTPKQLVILALKGHL